MVKHIKKVNHETLTGIFATTYDTDKINKCVDKGGEWIKGYHRKDGITVHGYCRKLKSKVNNLREFTTSKKKLKMRIGGK